MLQGAGNRRWSTHTPGTPTLRPSAQEDTETPRQPLLQQRPCLLPASAAMVCFVPLNNPAIPVCESKQVSGDVRGGGGMALQFARLSVRETGMPIPENYRESWARGGGYSRVWPELQQRSTKINGLVGMG